MFMSGPYNCHQWGCGATTRIWNGRIVIPMGAPKLLMLRFAIVPVVRSLKTVAVPPPAHGFFMPVAPEIVAVPEIRYVPPSCPQRKSIRMSPPPVETTPPDTVLHTFPP